MSIRKELSIWFESQVFLALNFTDNVSLETLDATTPKGPLGTKIWNATAAQASGSKAGLSDDTGATSTVTAAWSTTNTWRVGSAATTQDARIVIGYLDDGPATVTLTIPSFARDKKTLHGRLRFILSKQLGEVELVEGIEPSVVLDVLARIP